MDKRELLAIGERAAAHVGIGHAVDVLDHVGDRSTANAELERPAKAVSEQRIVVRHQRGLQRRFGGVGINGTG